MIKWIKEKVPQNEMPYLLAQKKIQTQNQFTGIKRLWLILLLGSLSAFGPLSLDMYLPALPQLTDDFVTSASLVRHQLAEYCLS
ncbi:hypothetical protein MHH56_21580 [Paenibacillus sp. FSL K6-3182]|uniref:hypothetical protein n=1 Tax=Paenibacillus sp. FSL K6-3182 TaxID=2921495 RepID=UPI0030CA9E35